MRQLAPGPVGVHFRLHEEQGEGSGLCGCTLMHRDAEKILTLFLEKQDLVGICLEPISISETLFLPGPFIEKFEKPSRNSVQCTLIKVLMRC